MKKLSKKPSKKSPKIILTKPEKKIISNVNAYGGESCGGGCSMLKW